MARPSTKSSFSKTVLIVAAVGATTVSAAHAQPPPQTQTEPSPADVESAKVAFTEGIALREKNDHAGALARFRAAYALVPTPITGLEVGRELIETGHILEGRALLLEVSRMPKKPGESDKAQQARDEASDLAEKSRAKLATLTVESDAPDVMIDDVPIPRDAAHAPRVLDPGHHVVVVKSPGKSGRAEIDLAPGEQHQIHVDADHDDTPKPPPVVRTHVVLRPGTAFWASVIVTGAGLVVGAGTGVAALAVTGHLSSECPSKSCPPSAYGDLNTSLALGWVSTIGFAVAGAGAIAAGVLLALSGHREPVPEPKAASVRLVPGLGGFSLMGSF
jgi:hypothetical protein